MGLLLNITPNTLTQSLTFAPDLRHFLLRRVLAKCTGRLTACGLPGSQRAQGQEVQYLGLQGSGICRGTLELL